VENNYGVIGTPDDAIALIQRLYDKQGDFGASCNKSTTGLTSSNETLIRIVSALRDAAFLGDNRPRIDSFNWCTDHRDELRKSVPARHG